MVTTAWIISVVGLAFTAISLLCTLIMTVAGFISLRRRKDYTRAYVSWVKASMTLGSIWMALWIGAMLSPLSYYRGGVNSSPRFHVYAVYQLFYLVTLAVAMATQVEIARGFKDESSGWIRHKTSTILLGVYVAFSIIRFILYEVSGATIVWVAIPAYAIDLIQFILLWIGSIVSLVYLVKRKGYFNPSVKNSHRVYKCLLAVFILTLLRQTFEGLYAIAYFISLFISTYYTYADAWRTILHIPRVIFTACTVTATFGIFFYLASLFKSGTRVKHDAESV